ncbi:UDP-N-acetylglucosamine 2-epimerase [Phaeocystidibacter marisrubri]|uniref:UDP-N-acetylglucosamine 2-epimerase (Hydrolyzing) n=1 Tax=Phaeocystidibacter marisrubri TaxID=1577780 RepID=A0A6L3ZHU5_9FLAO|nr:UDP-N-acetylglucosamine 2-epimerase [Phaeocystidibacter marisrubri]KAB2817586.1 UDP-N-acetylglucosamine 2-epimerase (hydrolyzing) [Phaeocystidibacter marisrubri]GGH74615.1 UDP-N-acetyl glucosamine 2-epimerase [Phaeocystidibacter marisrubri]
MMKIGVLTSSRADYGIYTPLLKHLQADEEVDLHIIVFGMHLTKSQGMTINLIEKDGFGQIHSVVGLSEGDTASDIVRQYGETVVAFSEYWKLHSFDLVFTLGDRFEMNAAVQSTIPFGIKLAHLHGGEKTLGAIDEIYRHQITLASAIHFTSTEEYAQKVRSLLPDHPHVYDVGALSLDGLNLRDLPSWYEVREQFAIPEGKFVLITFHPETVNAESNHEHIRQLKVFFTNTVTDLHFVVTMANSDAMGQLYRDLFEQLKGEMPDRFSLVETFGRDNYYAAMVSSEMLLGNTSSGIIEAASAGVYAINVGNRQDGRTRSNNVVDVAFDAIELGKALQKVRSLGRYTGANKYKKDDTAKRIVEIIKSAK